MSRHPPTAATSATGKEEFVHNLREAEWKHLGVFMRSPNVAIAPGFAVRSRSALAKPGGGTGVFLCELPTTSGKCYLKTTRRADCR